jgi:hypothetical protein
MFQTAEEMLAELCACVAERNITATDRDRLRRLAMTAGAAPQFAAELAKVAAAAPPYMPGAEPDCFEANRDNPVLHRAMRACGITAADVAKHGPRGPIGSQRTRIVPNLAEIIARSRV